MKYSKRLTPKQQGQVARLLRNGVTNKAIIDRLGITVDQISGVRKKYKIKRHKGDMFIRVSMPHGLYTQTKAVAELSGMTMSSYIRHLIEEDTK